MRFLPTHFVLSVERKNLTYREQRHRLSSARLFARREGRDRARATDFTERCCFKLSVLETDAFADKSMVDWTIEAILFVVVRSALIYMPTFGRPVLLFKNQHLEKSEEFFLVSFSFFGFFFKFLKGDRRFEIFFCLLFCPSRFPSSRFASRRRSLEEERFCDTLN